MDVYRGRYEPAEECADGPTPGARALMAWFLGAYGPVGGRNGGIFGCRTIAGTDVLSVHAEGRADDLMTGGAGWGRTLADALVVNSGMLGVQLVIHNRRVWSCSAPDAGWRDYHGINPHTDHLHVELTRAAASTLTAAYINTVLADPTEALMRAIPVVRQSSITTASQPVRNAQALLNAHGVTPALSEDGRFGPKTAAAVRAFQTKEHITVDGVVGPITWRHLLNAA
jgi:hypothetical protein